MKKTRIGTNFNGDIAYFRRGQIFNEATDFEPTTGVTYSAFGSGARPILNFSVTNALDFRASWMATDFSNRTCGPSETKFRGWS